MKKLLLIALICVCADAMAQSAEELRIFRIINVYREKDNMLPLAYRSRYQMEADYKALELRQEFKLSEDCGDCTGETVAKSNDFKDLLLKVTDRTQGWDHLNKAATGACIGLYKTDSTYYLVIRTY